MLHPRPAIGIIGILILLFLQDKYSLPYEFFYISVGIISISVFFIYGILSKYYRDDNEDN